MAARYAGVPDVASGRCFPAAGGLSSSDLNEGVAVFGKMFSGFAGMMVQRYLTRKVAGRVAGVATRTGGGIPGLIVCFGVSYLINHLLNRRTQSTAVPARR